MCWEKTQTWVCLLTQTLILCWKWVKGVVCDICRHLQDEFAITHPPSLTPPHTPSRRKFCLFDLLVSKHHRKLINQLVSVSDHNQLHSKAYLGATMHLVSRSESMHMWSALQTMITRQTKLFRQNIQTDIPCRPFFGKSYETRVHRWHSQHNS